MATNPASGVEVFNGVLSPQASDGEGDAPAPPRVSDKYQYMVPMLVPGLVRGAARYPSLHFRTAVADFFRAGEPLYLDDPDFTAFLLPEFCEDIARDFLAAGNKAEAAKYFERAAIKGRGEFYQLARTLYEETGDLKGAKRCHEEYFHLLESEAGRRWNIGDLDGARRWYGRALTEINRPEYGLEHLGKIYLQEDMLYLEAETAIRDGRLEVAVANYKQLLAIAEAEDAQPMSNDWLISSIQDKMRNLRARLRQVETALALQRESLETPAGREKLSDPIPNPTEPPQPAEKPSTTKIARSSHGFIGVGAGAVLWGGGLMAAKEGMDALDVSKEAEDKVFAAVNGVGLWQLTAFSPELLPAIPLAAPGAIAGGFIGKTISPKNDAEFHGAILGGTASFLGGYVLLQRAGWLSRFGANALVRGVSTVARHPVTLAAVGGVAAGSLINYGVTKAQTAVYGEEKTLGDMWYDNFEFVRNAMNWSANKSPWADWI